MTKLTTELLEKFVSDIKTDGMCDITDHQVALALRQLLAYEQAAKNPIGSFHISGGQVEATTDYCRDGEWPVQDGEVLVYAAPVLPKQPVKPVMFIDGDISSDDAEKLAAVIREFGNEPAPAQPVSEPKLNGWISVADRLPSEFGRYLCYVEEQNDLGKSHYQWSCSWSGDVFSDSALTGRVTHWMPLPAAPAQESE